MFVFFLAYLILNRTIKKNIYIVNSNFKRSSNQVYRNAQERYTKKSLKISQVVKMERWEKIRSAGMSSLFTFSGSFC